MTRICFSLVLLVAFTATGETPIVNRPFIVEPGHIAYFRFNTPEPSGRVQGRFRARGGSGNDIEAFILDEDGFENYRNGHSAATYYNSGRVTVGSIDITLGPGGYYLVFSNRMSLMTNKAVEANVSLRY